MHGFGRYILKENKTYEGEFYADKKHGYGIYTWPDGRVYEGYWKDSKQHGLAKYLIKQGATVQTKYGMWEEGARKQWYSIEKEKEILKQLNDIEDQYIKGLQVEAKQKGIQVSDLYIDSTLLPTFEAPIRFQERLMSSIFDAENLKLDVEGKKQIGLSKK